jgi:hypothetical protein
MNVGSQKTVPMDEERPVDDQAAWLDDATAVYAVAREASAVDFDIWSAPVDGGPARVLVPDAASPSVVRPGG